MTKPLAFIIEDDPQLSQIFTIALEDEFNVQAITDGKDAFERISKESPRIIILDLNLPSVSGVEILSKIRATPHVQATTVIVCTADERQAETIKDMVEFILLKPVSPIQLRQIASRLK